MYLYNISLIIEDNSHDIIIDWLRENWIPQIGQDIHFLKMIDSPHEGHTYCIQLQAKEKDEIEKFQQSHLAELTQYIHTQHREKAFIFDSLMQYL